MKVYAAPEGSYIAGAAARSMVDNLKTDEISDLVKTHNLENIQDGDWVPMQSMCDLFNDVQQSLYGGSSQVFVAMGMKIAEHSVFPPEILANLDMPTMIMGWNDHYEANHRGDLPAIVSEKISDTEFKVYMEGESHPYPYDMTYGMMYGFCRRLLPPDVSFKVEYDKYKSPYNQWQDGVVLTVSWDG